VERRDDLRAFDRAPDTFHRSEVHVAGCEHARDARHQWQAVIARNDEPVSIELDAAAA
jgi:hypothetical protein